MKVGFFSTQHEKDGNEKRTSSEKLNLNSKVGVQCVSVLSLHKKHVRNKRESGVKVDSNLYKFPSITGRQANFTKYIALSPLLSLKLAEYRMAEACSVGMAGSPATSLPCKRPVVLGSPHSGQVLTSPDSPCLSLSVR